MGISDCVQWKVSAHKIFAHSSIFPCPDFFLSLPFSLSFFLVLSLLQEIELNEKKEAVIASVIKAVNELCKCVFSRETFYDIDITAGFQCFDQSPTAVTFRGEIGPSLTANSSQLISYLEQWVATDPTIVVLSSRLSVDSSCSVEISNFNDPECSDMTSTSTKTAIIGGGVGGVLVILVAALALVVVVGLLRTHQKRASYNLSVGKDVDNIYE